MAEDEACDWDVVSVHRRPRECREVKECARWFAAYPTLRLDARKRVDRLPEGVQQRLRHSR
jgi:hypothetical protein